MLKLEARERHGQNAALCNAPARDVDRQRDGVV